MYDSREAARRAGNKARQRLVREGISLKGVKLDVFENLGWHWTLRHKHFGLSAPYARRNEETSFMLLMSPNGHGVGRCAWTGSNSHNPNPLSLLRNTLAIAKAEIAELQACVDDVEALLPKPRTPRCKAPKKAR